MLYAGDGVGILYQLRDNTEDHDSFGEREGYEEAAPT